MRATQIVGAALRLWSENWLRWGLVTLALSGVPSVLEAAIDPWTATYGARYWFGERPFSLPEPDPLASVVGLVTAFLLAPWLYVILAKGTLDAASERRPSALIGRTIRGVPSVLWLFAIIVACVAAVVVPIFAVLVNATRDASLEDRQAVFGLLALVMLGVVVWLGPRLAVLFHVFVAEDIRGTKAIGQAWRRSRGAWSTCFGVIALNVLIAIGVTLIPALLANRFFALPTMEDAVPRAIVFALINVILTPIGVAILAALYLELSARKGSLSQVSLQRNLARFDPSP